MKFCSIGTYCQSAECLVRYGLKEESYPFDWMFSSFDMIKHCIEDDFKSFLDKSQYYDIQKPEGHIDNLCGHTLYSPMINFSDQGVKGCTFPHRDPLNIEEDHQYYIRSVDRFRKLIKSDEEKVFIMFLKDFHFKDLNDALRQSTVFVNFLNRHIKNFNLIIVHYGVGKLKIHPMNSKNLRFINVRCSQSNGLVFQDGQHTEAVDKVIKRQIDEIRKTKESS